MSQKGGGLQCYYKNKRRLTTNMQPELLKLPRRVQKSGVRGSQGGDSQGSGLNDSSRAMDTDSTKKACDSVSWSGFKQLLCTQI